MRIVLVTSESDRYTERFAKTCEKRGVSFINYIYSQFIVNDEGCLNYGDKGFKGFESKDVVLFRTGDIGVHPNQDLILRVLGSLADLVGAKIIDRKYWVTVPHYRDKYVQSILYHEAGVEHIRTELLDDCLEGCEMPFPIIAKQRYGGMAVGIRILNNMEELRRFANITEEHKYIIQPFIKLKRDIRVLVVGGERLGSVLRRVKVRNDGSIGVRVGEEVVLGEEEEKLVSKYFDVFKTKMCGLDILVGEDDRIWVAEANYSPFFDGFERVMEVDVVEKYVDFLLKVNS